MAGFNEQTFFETTRKEIVRDLLANCKKEKKLFHPSFYGEKRLDLAKIKKNTESDVYILV